MKEKLANRLAAAGAGVEAGEKDEDHEDGTGSDSVQRELTDAEWEAEDLDLSKSMNGQEYDIEERLVLMQQEVQDEERLNTIDQNINSHEVHSLELTSRGVSSVFTLSSSFLSCLRFLCIAL